jgi:hypothetical protein
LLSRKQLPYPSVSSFNRISNRGYLFYHDGYFEITDTQFKRVAIFRANAGSAFVNASGKLFVLESGKPIRIYRPRKPVL